MDVRTRYRLAKQQSNRKMLLAVFGATLAILVPLYPAFIHPSISGMSYQELRERVWSKKN